MIICLVIALCLGLMAGTFLMARNMVKRGFAPAKAVLMQILGFALVYACTLGSSFAVTSADENSSANDSVKSSAVTQTAAEVTSENTSADAVEVQKVANKYWDSIAMAAAVGLACIGCGIAIASAAPAAIGAVSEDPKAFGKAMIFVGLAESVSLFGLLIAILIKFI